MGGRKADIDVFTPYNVFDALHVRYDGNKKNERVQCPRCGKFTFYMDMVKGVGHCMRGSCDLRVNHTGYYAETMGTDLEGAREEMYRYMGVPFKRKGSKSVTSSPASSIKKRERKVVVFDEGHELLPIEKRDLVNREIIKSHPFIDRHKKDMAKRGLTEEEIEKLDYCSYGYSDEIALGIKYQEKGLELKGVPGFHTDDDGNLCLRILKKGILIPFKDSEGRVQGFQLRKNNEELKEWIEKGEKKKELKCNWLSSTGLKDGTKIPAYCHYACDFVYNLHMDRIIPVIKNNKITVTEGGMKADIVHILTGMSLIAIAGVTCLNEFEKELPFLKEIGVETIADGLDMDYLTNKDVAKQREKIKQMIESNGFNYELVEWEVKAENHEDLKGLDDYYAYHLRGV